jgi:histidinol dehydrogenase
MKLERLEWQGAEETARRLRACWGSANDIPDVIPIKEAVQRRGDAAVLELTSRFDATEVPTSSLRVDPAEAESALSGLEAPVRESLELAAANVRAVGEAQVDLEPHTTELPQGHTVAVREVPIRAAGLYAPGGLGAYPSSVLMCAIPAQIAGVERLALASPPGPNGRLHPLVLAAAALCGVDEIYAMGGAQAIFALAYGTETVAPVDVIAGPGNAWVQEAKRVVLGTVGIDSYAGPSELMVIAGHDTDPRWAAFDLCAQGEHGFEAPLVLVAVEEAVLDAAVTAVGQITGAEIWPNGPVLVQAPDLSDAISLANAFAPEHLELLEEDAALLAPLVTTAGCVFVGRYAATAFGDYVAGSNHVLPTGGTGRFSGPLGPHVFRRKISTVEVTAEAAAKLAPHVDRIARAEGFPAHGESAMIRAEGA